MNAVHKRLNRLESQNLDLASKLEINSFEKLQVMRVLDSVSLGFIVLNMQDIVIHVNSFGLSLIKQDYDEVIDKKISQVLINEPILSFLSTISELEGSGIENKLETTFPDISPGKTFQVSFSYLHDSDEETIGKILIIENITNQKLAESAKGEFIAHVAHELLTPMTNIKSYNEMLMNDQVEDEELRIEFFNTINLEIDRLNDLINNLLNISKIEMGNLVLNKGLVKSDTLVQECVKSIEAAAMEKKINIETEFPDIFPSLFVDKELFRVAIVNVIGNALKYTPENGQITFSLQEKNGQIVFEVRDTGYGIPKKDLPHVFDKFYRSEQSDIKAQKGSGLGLALVDEIIKLHDGEIDIQSEQNKGTQVSINIPKENYYLDKS
jgi:signal transduction histidine kinase